MKNKDSLILSISTKEDINKITDNTKYINIDITNPNHEVITYFKKNGHNYKYADKTNDILGYNYVDYNTFIKAETIIDLIFASMPNDLTKIEISKYLYISAAKYLSYNINIDESKNEIYNLTLMNEANNLWGSLSTGNVTDITASKIYYYLCRRLDIETNIEIDESTKESLTKLIIDNQVLITDLYEDIPFIWANMQTRYFATYNDDANLDKRIKYLKNKYTDYYLDKALKNIDYTNEECVWLILNKTKDILNIETIKPSCLSTIYKYIFNKYCKNYNIKINNLFLNSNFKKHFILISYNNIHYSYNYKKKEFSIVNNTDIIENINEGKIGLYYGELIPSIDIS